jgi:hypothetical protein
VLGGLSRWLPAGPGSVRRVPASATWLQTGLLGPSIEEASLIARWLPLVAPLEADDHLTLALPGGRAMNLTLDIHVVRASRLAAPVRPAEDLD